MKNINNNQLRQKNVIVRVDLNLPVVDGKITDKSRIDIIKSTIFKLIEGKNKIFIVSHFRRPKGKFVKKYSLEFLCKILLEELNLNKVYFINEITSENILKKIKEMNYAEVCLMENIRFYEEEEKNDLLFAKEISKSFDFYVNDAFSASHRSHASIVGITKYLPSLAGDSLLKEINNLNSFISNPKKPNTAIIGGSKISTKINVLNNLIELFDNIIVGGAMANTFLLLNNINIGTSLVEKDLLLVAKKILEKAKNYNCNFILPIDVVCADSLINSKNIKQCKVNNILPNQMILDVGGETIDLIETILLKSKMILWNGPLGAFEYEPFNHATNEIANKIKKNSNILNLKTLAGGGDTISAIKMAKAESAFSYISTSGGAFLEWLEGKESPGVKALKENKF